MHARSLRTLASLALLALAAPAVAADIVVWHGYRGEEKAAIEKVAASYNAKKGASGAHVSLLAVPFDGFADKITAAIPRGKGPDVFIYAQDRMGGWIEAGKTIEPIDFFLDTPTKLRFIPTTLQAMTYKGNIWGLPLNYKCITLIYNKKLVKDPPRTTAEMEELARKLTNKGAGTYGLVYDYLNYYHHSALQNGFGGRAFESGARPVVNSPQNVKAIELLLKWKDEFLPAEPSNTLVTTLFNTGKAAMVFNGPWFLGEIAKEIDYGLSPLPNISENNGTPMRPWMTVEGVFVTPSSQQKDAAFDFVKYFTDVDAGTVMGIEGRQTPANVHVYQDRRVAADPVLRGFYRQVRVAVPMPNYPEMTMMWGPVTTAMGTIGRKAATPQAALDKAQAAIVKDIQALRAKR